MVALEGVKDIQLAASYERPPFDPACAALVVVDMINWQVPRTVVPGTLANEYFVGRVNDQVIPVSRRLIDASRAAGVPVVFLRVGAAEADYSDSIVPLREIARAAGATEATGACDVIPELEARPGDVSLLKTGSGGFTTSGLHESLRGLGVEHVFYTGVLTNACVLLTAAAGYDLGYRGYLVADATATISQDIQDATEQLISCFIAEVVESDAVLALLAPQGAPSFSEPVAG